MPSDKSKKSNKKTNNAPPIMKKKKNSDSDNDEPFGEIEEVEMDMNEFRKELHKIFPSKYLKSKIKNSKKKDDSLYANQNSKEENTDGDEDNDDDEDDNDDDEDY